MAAGPMVGLTTPTTAEIWVAAEKSHIRLRYWPRTNPEEVHRTAAQFVDEESHGLGNFELRNLEPDAAYLGQVIADDQAASLFEFRTLPSEAEETDFRIALGSCAYLNDPATDHGSAYGGNPRIFRSIVEEDPLLMLWLGDNVYYRDSDLQAEALMRRRQMRIRRQPDAAALFRRCANFAIWDDHDFGPNDSDGSFKQKALTRQIFCDFWPNSKYSKDPSDGLYFRQRIGDVEIFATDGRFHRSPNKMTDGPKKTMLGQKQRDWLIRSLGESDAAFKIVVFGGQVLNPICRFEGMAKFSHEREFILDAITKAKIKGVFFVSGDRHHSELIQRPRENSYPLYDFTTSPLLSGTHGRDEEKNDARVPGSYVTDQRNYGILQFEGRGPDRQMRLSICDLDGLRVFETIIRARELQ